MISHRADKVQYSSKLYIRGDGSGEDQPGLATITLRIRFSFACAQTCGHPLSKKMWSFYPYAGFGH